MPPSRCLTKRGWDIIQARLENQHKPKEPTVASASKANKARLNQKAKKQGAKRKKDLAKNGSTPSKAELFDGETKK